MPPITKPLMLLSLLLTLACDDSAPGVGATSGDGGGPAEVSVAGAALSAAKSALSIAILYGAKRRQFGPAGELETPILDYQTHQRRLMPRLARTFAFDFGLQYLKERYLHKTDDDAQEVEALAAGLKAGATWHATDTIQTSRECCGGNGYLSENRFASLKGDTDVFATFEGDNIVLPAWAYGAQRALIVLFAVYLALLPVSWHRVRGPVISGLAATALLNTALVTLIVHAVWLPVVLPALFVVSVQVLLTLAARRTLLLTGLQQQATQARLELGRNLQSQGQLDPAMEQLVRCLPAPAALEPLYELGLEYERRRQVARAQSIYAHLEAAAGEFRDASRRRERLVSLSDRFPNANGAGVNRTLILDNPVMELPVLGRYQLQRELGSGAMGTVYLALDPNIGREVAVKALPLLETPEGAEQEAVTERFFREAEAVGRLDHPNIVTVHDVGKEHDLAYMAMDYVPGESLDAWTHRSTLLPVWEVLEAAAQVADALAYAHGRKVVHRDIKPSNIIYDRASGLAKITDFGVARMLDSNRTRTGTILGSPSYMSPEQVAGSKVDGRSDLFSLGTTLYQLLSGSLPFRGDSVANVMYQIANAKTPPLRKARQGLPASVTRLVMRALQKDPGKRFVSGADMATAIRKCRAQLRGGRRKTA